MKDRIRQIQEAQHMSQQIFADYIGVGAATLSSIYNGRTRPTLNIVENIKRKLPSINLEWLMFGTGRMFADGATPANETPSTTTTSQHATNDIFSAANAQDMAAMLDIEDSASAMPVQPVTGRERHGAVHGAMNIQAQQPLVVERPPRHVTEIRVYFDDQTWESFTPSKSR